MYIRSDWMNKKSGQAFTKRSKNRYNVVQKQNNLLLFTYKKWQISFLTLFALCEWKKYWRLSVGVLMLLLLVFVLFWPVLAFSLFQQWKFSFKGVDIVFHTSLQFSHWYSKIQRWRNFEPQILQKRGKHFKHGVWYLARTWAISHGMHCSAASYLH